VAPGQAILDQVLRGLISRHAHRRVRASPASAADREIDPVLTRDPAASIVPISEIFRAEIFRAEIFRAEIFRGRGLGRRPARDQAVAIVLISATCRGQVLDRHPEHDREAVIDPDLETFQELDQGREKDPT
jgi:hypothetical protein